LKNKIQSFEVSQSDNLGDVISSDRKRNTFKLCVGVLPLAWFEWWPMFPESDMESQIKDDGQRFVEQIKTRFGNEFNIVAPDEIVDTLDKAYDAGELFKKSGVEALIIDETTYLTDFIPIEVLEHLPDVPIIIFATQATDNLFANMHNRDVIRYEGLVGNTQLTGAFAKMKRKYKVVVGSLENEQSYLHIENHLKVLSIIKKLRQVDIGLLGHTFRGMYDIEIDKTKIKGAFGPNIIYLDVSHLLKIWEDVSNDDIDEFIMQLKKDIPVRFEEVTDEDVKKSVSLGIALQRLIDRFRVDGLSLLGQHHVEVNTKASADFSFYCAEKNRCMTTHEGDLANLVMKLILNYLSNKLPVFLEWSAFDLQSNTILLTHHGVVDPIEHANNISNCRFTPSPEKWDFTGKGLSVEYSGKPGKVTLACIINVEDGWKIFVSKGEILEREAMPAYAPQFYFKPDSLDVREYIEKIMNEGVAHHVCLVYGDYSKLLKLYSEYIGMKFVEV
jgi:L-arabinose isomerase